MRFIDYLKSLLDRFVGGSFERMRIVQEMNMSFKEMYCTGAIEYFCKVSISMGESAFRHEMSAFIFRSGFKVTIENDANLQKSEMRELASYITTNKAFLRQLMTLGFDTLIIAGKTTGHEHKYEIRKFTSALSYMLES